MKFDPVNHLIEMMRVRGVGVNILAPPYDNVDGFDDGLRNQLYGEYDFKGLVQALLQRCNVGVVYLSSDRFDLKYVIIKVSTTEFIMIGPYTARPHEEVFNSACENFTIPEGRLSELRGYFYGIPYVEVCDIFEAEIILLAKYIFNNEEHTVERMDLPFFATENEAEIKEVFEDRLSLLMIEELYQNEDDYLEAVERGDLKQATIIMSMFRKFTMESRHADSLRNQKNYGLVLNTLLRKTVQRAAVHPAYIHQISRSFAVRIEAARTSSELVTKIFQSMLRKYCGLVNNHSLKNYTLPIRKAINFIDFNYAEQITLDKIAESVSFNYAYLSSQFKKETGSTVIDYINMKRIQKAVTLLSTTTLSIGEIAEKCGFVDDTYFTRVFKKKQGVSPREYRKSIFKN